VRNLTSIDEISYEVSRRGFGSKLLQVLSSVKNIKELHHRFRPGIRRYAHLHSFTASEVSISFPISELRKVCKEPRGFAWLPYCPEFCSSCHLLARGTRLGLNFDDHSALFEAIYVFAHRPIARQPAVLLIASLPSKGVIKLTQS